MIQFVGTVLLGIAMGRGDLVEQGKLEVQGSLRGGTDLSAVERCGDLLLIVADESQQLQVLRKKGARQYQVEHNIPLSEGDRELDLEAIAVHGQTCWALGSHALKRPRIDDDARLATNRRKILEVKHEPTRDCLFRFELDDNGLPGPIVRINLRPIFENDPVLAPFARIPGKENGLDFEGMTWHDGRLFLGLRSPVLRGNFAVVMVLNPDAPEQYQLRYLDIRGFGIRALASVAGGLLGIAGPINGLDEDHRLFFWDGEDGLPGKDVASPETRWYGKIPGPKKGKAEGLAVLAEHDDHVRILVVYDGVKGGQPSLFDVPR